MIIALETWLIATAAIPVFGSVGVLVAILIHRRTWALSIARLGLAGGFVGGAVLAALLAGGASPEIRLTLWTWYSFSRPQSPSIVFGLEATWIKAGLMSLTGAITLLALWSSLNRKKQPFSDNMILTVSSLYAAGIVFVFAPNLAQAFLGWGSISLLAGILITLTHQESRSMSVIGKPLASSQPLVESTPGGLDQRLQSVANGVAFFERVFVDRIWLPITRQFPNWLGEQAETIENSSQSFQLLATVLAASAILLTWLI